jgi:hypothetical protein
VQRDPRHFNIACEMRCLAAIAGRLRQVRADSRPDFALAYVKEDVGAGTAQPVQAPAWGPE